MRPTSILLSVLLAVSFYFNYALIQDGTEQRESIARCEQSLTAQSQKIEQQAIEITNKNALAKQAARHSVNAILNKQTHASRDAAELNAWLQENFATDEGLTK